MLASANKVFETMFFQSVELWEPTELPDEPAYLISVYFETESSGCFEMMIGMKKAQELARDFLPEGSHGEIAVGEICGELANMVCGRFLTDEAEGGVLRLQAPVCALSTYHQASQRSWQTFQLDGQPLFLRVNRH